MHDPTGEPAKRTWPVLVAVVGAVLLTRVWLVAQPPAFSDIPAYWHDAAIWGAAGETGTSFYDLHRAYVVQVAGGLGRTPPEGTTLLEYPPLAVAVMAAVNVALPSSPTPGDTADLITYGTRYRLVAWVVDLLILIALGAMVIGGPPRWRWSTAWRLAVYGVGGMATFYVLYDRLDLFEGALLLASLLALVRGRWMVALVLLGVAVDFKVYPAVLAPIWLVAALPASAVAQWRERRGRLVRLLAGRSLVLAGAVVAGFLPFLVVQGPDALQFVAFNAQRGLQLESVGAALLLVLHSLGWPAAVVTRYGAYELVGPLAEPLALAAIAATVAAVTGVWLLFLRAIGRALPAAPDERPVATHAPQVVLLAAVATLMVVLVTGKVLSPQYLLWLLPLVPLLEGGWGLRGWQVGFVIALALSTVIFPGLYGGVSLAGPLVPAIIVRDTVLVGLALALCARLAAPWRAAPRDRAPLSRRSGTTTSSPASPARPTSCTSTCTSSTR